ncbi:hypothetical protein BGZ94_004245, partial [Podila epigama]
DLNITQAARRVSRLENATGEYQLQTSILDMSVPSKKRGQTSSGNTSIDPTLAPKESSLRMSNQEATVQTPPKPTQEAWSEDEDEVYPTTPSRLQYNDEVPRIEA